VEVRERRRERVGKKKKRSVKEKYDAMETERREEKRQK
jgi:hypothetical protein